MQRYFVEPEQMRDNQVIITGEDANHIVRVMRMKPNEKIIVSDGVSRTALARISESEPASVVAEIVEWLPRNSEPAWSITIAQSLPKGDKMELVIQKGTEIGAMAFLPFQSKRMIVQYDGKKEAKRLERWSKIAKEAAEQAHRHRIPIISQVHSWRELLKAAEGFDLVLFCYEQEGHAAHGRGIGTAVKEWRSKQEEMGKADEKANSPKVLLVVGPEGGFAEEEASQAEEAGAICVSLGKRILRTETAGIVGLTCLLYESGEMGGA
ncbi:RsmE family RNA methyltransferase [Paenibacillus sp. HB172176]|uniref:RsmE family RNA methyltransferase n=1 Tax=Paenibacillus sp. HB172176 TaxID=2493690 RepID=UPI00143B78F9|nr:RsmE family RNA methyltransferase [Paenibacillus sp. HB172176]